MQIPRCEKTQKKREQRNASAEMEHESPNSVVDWQRPAGNCRPLNTHCAQFAVIPYSRVRRTRRLMAALCATVLRGVLRLFAAQTRGRTGPEHDLRTRRAKHGRRGDPSSAPERSMQLVHKRSFGL